MSYTIARLLAKVTFAVIARVHVLHAERTGIKGPLILAANHISHFDPPALTVAAQRKVDWMAMAELFSNPFVAFGLKCLDIFPADRTRVDQSAVRTALERLGRGRIVGLFPEGGIRAGETSIVNGAAMRPGVATLAQMAQAAVLPCVIIGTDRLYNRRNWLPLRRTGIWISFGEPITIAATDDKETARALLREKLAAAYPELLRELREFFSLTEHDLPHTPQERMNE